MGTEMRIGIAAGLVIVAATSVYFIYGSDRSDGDLLLTPDKTADASAASSKSKTADKSDKTATRNARSRTARSNKPATRELRVANSATRNRVTPTPSRAVNRTNANHTNTTADKPSATATNLADATRLKSKPPIVNSPVARNARQPAANAANREPLVLTKSSEAATPASGEATVPPARMPANRKTNPLLPTVESRKAEPGTAITKSTPAPRSTATAERRSDTPNRIAHRTPARRTTMAPMGLPSSSDNRRTPPIIVPDADRREASVTTPHDWPKSHTIEAGDTLSEISMKYYGTSRRVDDIVKANPEINGPRSLHIGRTLVIPEPDAAIGSERESLVRLASTRESAPAERTSTARRTSSPIVVASPRKYTVEKGDTFYSIARKLYGTTARWKELYNANKATVSSPSKLKPGMELKVPS